MEVHEAQWCRRFAELLLSTGAIEVGLAVQIAHATYQGASLVSPEEALWLLRAVAKEAALRSETIADILR